MHHVDMPEHVKMGAFKSIKELDKGVSEVLSSVCYEYMGTRWSDLVGKNDFVKAINLLSDKYKSDVKISNVKSNTSSNGASGNVANSNNDWSLTVEIGDKKYEVSGHWSQMFSSTISIDGNVAFKSDDAKTSFNGYFLDFIDSITNGNDTKKQVPDFTPKIPNEIAKLTNRSDLKDAYTVIGKDLIKEKYGDVTYDTIVKKVGNEFKDQNGVIAVTERDMLDYWARNEAKREFGDVNYGSSKTAIINNMKQYYTNIALDAEEKWRKEQNDAYWNGTGAKRKKEIEDRISKLGEFIQENKDKCMLKINSILGISNFTGISGVETNVKFSSSSQSIVISFNSSDEIRIERDNKSWTGDEDWHMTFSAGSMVIRDDDSKEMDVMLAKSKIMTAYIQNKGKIEKTLEIGADIQRKIHKENRELTKELEKDHSED